VSNPKVAILGAGSVSAFILAACKEYGINPDIYTKGSASSPAGAFWYHWIPKSIDQIPSKTILIYSVGDPEGYVSKQWGSESRIDYRSSSFPRMVRSVQGWDPRKVYPIMMGFSNIIYSGRDQGDEYSLDKSKEYDLVFQTYPTEHHKESKGSSLVFTPTTSYNLGGGTHYNSVIYNGNKDDEVVRLSILFDYIHYEWVKWKVIKPDPNMIIGGFNDIHPSTEPVLESGIADNVILMGRYACWDRRLLSHEAYDETRVILEGYDGKPVGGTEEAME